MFLIAGCSTLSIRRPCRISRVEKEKEKNTSVESTAHKKKSVGEVETGVEMVG
jgi:hypothetical protein